MTGGCFITFEGGEGAGKTTMIGRTGDWLESRGFEVIRTREPGGTVLAEQIRNLVLGVDNDELCAKAELLLVFAARAQHLDELIRPALAAGKLVLCDRFTDATWAYQGGGRGIPPQLIGGLEEAVHGDLQPDLTVLLDVPVSTGMQRASGRGAVDRIESESIAFFEKVRSTYLERAKALSNRFAIVDAAASPEDVWAQIESVLSSRLVK